MGFHAKLTGFGLVLASALALALPVSGHTRPAAPATAANDARIPAGSLAQVCARIARRYRVSVAFADPRMGRLRSRGVALGNDPAAMLARAVEGLPLEVVRIDRRSFRIVAATSLPPREKTAPVRSPAPVRPAPAPPPIETEPAPPIIVTGSKHGAVLESYPASIQIISGGALDRGAANGTGAILAETSSLAMTGLGAGREKIFLRGVGDSSFAAETPATVGQYLDEARLNYAAPDPGLMPVDLARVEIVAGPQGTLYGAGSLGGVLRLVPAAPELGELFATLRAGLMVRESGGVGGQFSALANIPLAEDAAARLVGYRFEEPGYVDNPVLGRKDIDRGVVQGARAALALEDGSGWKLNLTAVGQETSADDRDYVDSTLGRARGNTIAEPYASDFLLLGATATKARGKSGEEQVLTISATRHGSRDIAETRNGAEPEGGAIARENLSRTFAGEYRIAGETFVVGSSFLASKSGRDTDIVSDSETVTSRTATRASEAAMFGEYRQALGAAQISLGLRAGLYRSSSTGEEGGIPASSREAAFRLLPSIGVSIAGDGLVPWARYAMGYRPPIAPTVGLGNIGLRGDRLHSFEMGLRRVGNHHRLTGSASMSFARWYDVQAEIADSTGRPITANAGNATIINGEAMLAWRASEALSISGAVTLNRTRLVNRDFSTIIVVDGKLPNVPDVSALASAQWRGSLGKLPLRAGFRGRYVGRSLSGVGTALGRGQGGYALVDFHAELDLSPLTLSLRLENALDSDGRRFGLGSTGFLDRVETFVPVKPRTLSLEAAVEF